jgi:hypothetical protein
MLSWNIPPGATGFTIFDVTDDLELTTVDATTTQYLIAGYAPRVTRQYSVNTLLGASMTTSNVVTLTTSPATPATPTVSNGLVEQITMSSNLPAGATALQFSVNGQLYTAPAPGTALSLTGLPPCASYTVYARSIDALGAYSAWSAAATSRTAPPAPTNVALSVDGGNNLVISFAQPANAACVVKTRFRRGTVPGVYDVTSDTSGISSGHVDVSAASTYYYALFNEAGSNGTSPNSTEISNAPRVPARMRMRTGL